MPRLDERLLVRLAPLAAVALATAAEGDGAGANAIDALLEAMFLLAIADGDLDPEELKQLAQACRRLLGDVVEGDIEGLFFQWSAAVAEEGWERRLGSIAASVAGSELAEPAFRLAVAVAMADGRIVVEEADGIDMMAQALGIRPDIAGQIVQDVVRELRGSRP